MSGIFVNVYALKMVYRGESCYVGITNIYLSLAMYCSYFVLFCNFFLNTYLRRPKDKVKVGGYVYYFSFNFILLHVYQLQITWQIKL